jgi:hypothetical protein
MVGQIRDAYADESGDPGYRFSENSSPRFVVGVVLPEQPEPLIDRLLALRRRLGRPATYEFHFRQSDARLRNAFFATLTMEKLQLLVAVIHNPSCDLQFIRDSKGVPV